MWIKTIFRMSAVVIVIFVVIVALQPGEFRIARSITIGAPTTAIFPHVNTLRAWKEWSPWAKIDPNAKETYEGPASGVGAAMSWSGNREVGEGIMTITESHPTEMVRLRLDFIKPMKATNTADFTFLPEGKQTLVTWSMAGNNNFIAKAFGLFVNCDKMVGDQFEKGLADLKTIAETPQKKR